MRLACSCWPQWTGAQRGGLSCQAAQQGLRKTPGPLALAKAVSSSITQYAHAFIALDPDKQKRRRKTAASSGRRGDGLNEHPLAHRHIGNGVVDQVGSCPCDALGAAGRAKTLPLAV